MAEWGLSPAIGPVSLATLAAAGGEEALFSDNSSKLAGMVDAEVKALIEGALEVAMDVVNYNRKIQDSLSADLEEMEKMDGVQLNNHLASVQVPPRLREFVMQGKLPGKRFSIQGPA